MSSLTTEVSLMFDGALYREQDAQKMENVGKVSRGEGGRDFRWSTT
jgi:hypothetical protein